MKDLLDTQSSEVFEIFEERGHGKSRFLDDLDELIDIKETHPLVTGTKSGTAFIVYALLLGGPYIVTRSEIAEGDVLARYRIIFIILKGRRRSVVHDVKSANTKMIVMVQEPFVEIPPFPLDGHAHGNVFAIICPRSRPHFLKRVLDESESGKCS